MIRSIRQLKNIKGKRVLMRVDFNVSVHAGKVPAVELARIRAALPTIVWLRKRGARLILVTHLGRPKGKRSEDLSTKPMVSALSKLLGTKIQFVPESHGPRAKQASEKLHNGEILLLENVRFEAGEESNDSKFARELSTLADIFVNDAFAASHRAHASVVGVTNFLPSYAGLLLEREVKNLSKSLSKPKHPFVLVMGGIKIETKLPVVSHLLPIADTILLGGALAEKITLKNKKIVLPLDTRDGGLDIGPKTEELYRKILLGARTIVWNGPLGRCEDPRYRHGTLIVARTIAEATKHGAYSVVGGGDTIPVLESARLAKSISFISTGGGAMLEYLSGKPLPGLNSLTI